MMRRREFITLLGGGAAAWPLMARAQQRALPVIGYLSSQSADSTPHLVAAFRRGLNEVGYVEGQSVSVEYRFAQNQNSRLPELAADLVKRQVVVIVASGSSAPAAKSATATIPIVFDTNDDPIKLGLVAGLNRPGGNATGVTFFTPSLDGKRVQLLHDLIPKAVGGGVLINPDGSNVEQVLPEIREAARVAGLQLNVIKASTERDIDAAFATLADWRAEVLLVATNAFFTFSRDRLATLAARYAIPAIYGRREFAAAGGLISYGESLADAYHQMGIYAGKILNGAKPDDLPVMQLTKMELVINLKTAKALGLTVPPNLLAIADEVIE
jgi:putative ABC transport system substrate-binding protein